MSSEQMERELLELAGKAADVRIRDFGNLDTLIRSDANEDGGPVYWNPLADDGDALRLAVKLNLFGDPIFRHYRSLERFGNQVQDDYAATRRAIVRAAAQLAKGEEE